MLRTSLIALAALTLAACDDEEDAAAVKEVEVAELPASTEDVAEADTASVEATAEQETATGSADDVTAAAKPGEDFGTETRAPLEASGAAVTEPSEQVSTTTDGSEAEAMQRYRDWLLGTWGVDGQCDSRIVEMQEGRMTLPGGISCDGLSVQANGDRMLVVGSESCRGTGSTDAVEIQVSRTDGGVTFARGDRQAELARCE